MSFILDALKKSEIERQRQIVPGLMDTRAALRRRPLPIWAIALAALLGINLIVLMVVLTRGSTKTAPMPVVQGATPAQSLHRIERPASPQAPEPAVDHFSPLDTAPIYAPEIPVAADARPFPSASSGRASSAAAQATITGSPRALRRPDPILIDEDTKADNQEVLPSISELHLSGAQALPELHLDVHVYATKAAERFVYINMRKYHEGAALQEGPTLEHIRRDGVVLNYQGLRFILPRQP
jgi:general secretion pathway protein B